MAFLSHLLAAKVFPRTLYDRIYGMKLTSAAKLVSRLMHPVLTFPVSIVLLFGVEQAWQNLAFVLIFSFSLPFLYFFQLFTKKKVSDFDISRREQRYPVYAASLLGMLASLAYLYFESSTFLFYEFLRLFCLAITLVCINFKIKVSIHTASAMILTILWIEFYHGSFWIFLLIPFVVASRLILKRHSWLEVGLGIFIPLLFYFSSLFPAFAR